MDRQIFLFSSWNCFHFRIRDFERRWSRWSGGDREYERLFRCDVESSGIPTLIKKSEHASEAIEASLLGQSDLFFLVRCLDVELRRMVVGW